LLPKRSHPALIRQLWNTQMALISVLEEISKERQTVHKATRCLVSDFVGSDGKRYLQLDTFGSEDRAFPAKVSQSIQFDEDGARALKALINKTFPHLR
jgi:hypothetical protein